MGRILNIYPREVIMGICLIEGWGELVEGCCLHVCVFLSIGQGMQKK